MRSSDRGIRRRRGQAEATPSIMNQAMRILRKYGTDAHLWMPGVGYVNGVTAGNWIDSAGTQAGVVDNPVGLVVDAQATLGPELVTNGDFSDGTTNGVSAAYTQYGSTIANVNSVLRVTSTGSIGQVNVGTAVGANPAKLTVKAGSTYRISISTGNRSGSGTFDIRAGTTNEGAQLYRNTSLGPNASVTLYVVATSPDLYIGLLNGSTAAGGWNEWDNISVRELVGAIPATQTTTANKPILRRGLVNLLTYSQDLTNAIWGKSNISVNGERVSRIATGSTCYLHRAATCPVNSYLTVAIRVKAATIGGSVGLRIQSAYPDRADAVFNLTTNQLVGTNSVNFTNTNTSFAKDGEYAVVTITSMATATAVVQIVIGPTDSGATIGQWEAASPTLSNVDISAAAIFQGAVTAQQIIDAGGIPLTTTASASSAAGRNYWEFDGSNDSLVLSGPVFQFSDDQCVVLGADATNASSYRSIANPSFLDANNYSAQVLIEAPTGKVYAEWKGGGAVALISTSGSVVGPRLFSQPEK